MIAADTSSLVAYFNGEAGADVERLATVLAAAELPLPPVVVTEILSDPATAAIIEKPIRQLHMLELGDGYWVRAARARSVIHRHGLKAKVADALIAQACIHHDIALITRDRDFRHFARYCGLKLA